MYSNYTSTHNTPKPPNMVLVPWVGTTKRLGRSLEVGWGRWGAAADGAGGDGGWEITNVSPLVSQAIINKTIDSIYREKRSFQCRSAGIYYL